MLYILVILVSSLAILFSFQYVLIINNFILLRVLGDCTAIFEVKELATLIISDPFIWEEVGGRVGNSANEHCLIGVH